MLLAGLKVLVLPPKLTASDIAHRQAKILLNGGQLADSAFDADVILCVIQSRKRLEMSLSHSIVVSEISAYHRYHPS